MALSLLDLYKLSGGIKRITNLLTLKPRETMHMNNITDYKSWKWLLETKHDLKKIKLPTDPMYINMK